MATELVPDFTAIRGDDWTPLNADGEIACWEYLAYDTPQDLSDTVRWQVRGQLRATKLGTDQPTGDALAVMTFDTSYLEQSKCVPSVARSYMDDLPPGKFYVGDIQVTDLTGPYGRISVPRFLLYVDYDVTDIPEEP